jgi:hypothetical protein
MNENENERKQQRETENCNEVEESGKVEKNVSHFLFIPEI